MNASDETINYSEALQALKDMSVPYPVRFLSVYSDLSPVKLKELMQAWPSIPITRKVSLLEDLEALLEKDTLVNYDDLARALLYDPEPSVRIPALRLLWECEEPAIIPDLVNISANDTDESARANAASLLGKFILIGELDALKPGLKELLIDHLVNIVLSSEKEQVKQRALESLGYASHPAIPELIRNAFDSTDTSWVTAALCAIGRSADDVWAPQVESMLTSLDPEVQFEAIRAAGELELASAREQLLELLDEDIEDEEIRLALIWSLSQIGGDEVKEKLDELLHTAVSDEEIEWLEKAMENLDLSASSSMDLLDFSPDEDDEFDPDLDDEPFDDEDLDAYELDDDDEDA